MVYLIRHGEKSRIHRHYVFTNDFVAILPNGETSVIGGGLSPRLDWTLPEMPEEAIPGVVDAWAEQTEELGRQYCWVQVFENKGDIMGCSKCASARPDLGERLYSQRTG